VKRLIGAILIVGLAVTAGRYVFIKLGDISWFCLSDVNIDCPDNIEQKQALVTSRLKIGESIFVQDLVRAGDALLRMPGVESVKVKRKLPSSVEIRMEPEEVVLFVKKNKIYGLTRALKLVDIGSPKEFLPVVTGLSDMRSQNYQNDIKLCYSLELYDNMKISSKNLSGRLSEIHFLDSDRVELIFDPGGVKVLLPLRNYPESLARLVTLDSAGILGNSGSFDMTTGKIVVKNGV
jgi:cell division septal protein FtsQ